MKNNKTTKILGIILLTIITVLTLGQGKVRADGTLTATITDERYIANSSGGFTKTKKYTLGGHTLFQVVSVDGSNHITGNNFYCLNQNLATDWTKGSTKTYNVSKDLVEDASEIQNSTTLLTEYKNVVTNSSYKKVLWVLDHMYTKNGISVSTLLANAGIVVDNEGYYYYDESVNPNSVFSDTESDPFLHLIGNAYGSGPYYSVTHNGTKKDILLNEQEVQAIQQAVIWYFTNNSANSSFYRTKGSGSVGEWFEYTEDTTGDATIDAQIKLIKQEQAAILFNYLVDGANAAGSGYTSTSTGTISIAYTGTGTSAEMTKNGANYKIGPFKVTTTGSATISGVEVTTGTNDTVVSGVTLQNASGTTISKPTKNVDFYVVIPQSSVKDSIVKIKAKGSYTGTKKTLWVNTETNSDNALQPLVEYSTGTTPISSNIIPVTEQKLFDLALRKIITKVGTSTELKNENSKSANRNVTVDERTLPDTATYKHRKDPVVVKEGDIVTYNLKIYNEGDIDGYASKIVDQLPTGLQSMLKTGDTVKSSKGNTYTATYDATSNKLTLTITGTTKVSIPAYTSGNLAKNADTIELTAKVTQKAATNGTTKYYLTNVAYIAEEYDKDGNKITQDRNGNESKPTVSPTRPAGELTSTDANNYKGKTSNQSVYNDTNNNYYYQGQEDDDDFEKVVVMPKSFDLSLRKIITQVEKNGTAKTIENEAGTKVARNVKIDTSTIPVTATYKHTKSPVVVEKGDTVVYQLNIYNEGNIDGYASKIVDQLPTGLQSSLKTGDVVVSKVNENTYTVEYDEKTNKVTLVLDKTKTIKSIDAFNGTTLKFDSVELICKVTQTPATDGETKHYLTNIAYIAEEYDKDGNMVTQDRDGNESKPTVSPNKTKDELNSTDADSYKGNTSNQSVKTDTTNSYYYKGEQDDDDFEKVVVMPKEFDLKLIKYISAVNGEKSNRKITVDTTNLNKEVEGKKVTTAKYDVTKVPLTVQTGDLVTYTFRIYNEGNIAGYASEITENIPEGLEYVASENKNPAWTLSSDGKTIKTDYLANKLIDAYDGKTLDYEEVSVVLKVTTTDVKKIIRNEAEISNDKDENGNDVTDRDSKPEEWKKENSDEKYENNPAFPKYKEDDEDYDNIKIMVPDIALRKFISKVSSDGNFKNEKTTKTYNREPEIDSSKLKIGTRTTAIYNHSKMPLELYVGDYVLYTLRAYNEGSVAGYASQIIDYLPEYLDFVDSTEESIKAINDNWEYDPNTRKVTTKSDAPNTKKLLKAFDKKNDNEKGSGLDYVDVQIICKINKNAQEGKKLTNIAEISEYKNEHNVVIPKDEDSEPKNITYPENPETYKDDEISKPYVPGQQDDDDFEKVIVKEKKKFDLALRKFITEISGKEVTTRVPKLSYENGKIIYTHPKDVVKVLVNDTVVYTLRVFNEGELAGYAERIADDIPEHLEFLPDNEINKEYKWKMYNKDGKETDKVAEAVRIETDYASRANGEEENLLAAFDKNKEISENNPSHIDVKVAFKVKDPSSNKTVITNKAQITEDADENGNPVDDIDSVPDKWNEGEDDQDYENVSVEYFDLSLLKYVTKAIVTENGKTKTTKTGNTGASTDITPKVEIYRKNLNKTVVKFEYIIKITNEGDIEGYAKEITDYVPKGLKFYKEDNTGWKDEGNNVISTKLLENTLLKPGESATVKVVLRWINGESNLGLKTNTAEISEDYNEKDVPDRDSTPDNKKPGEDDIDDAPVLLTISTGTLEHTMQYVTGALIILVILGLGVIAIKKFVL